MHKLVILKLGDGNFDNGFPVTLEIGDDDSRPSTVIAGKLPPAPNIPQYYQNWQSAYRQLGVHFRDLKRKSNQIKNVSIIPDAAQILNTNLNIWLNSEEFRSIKDGFQRNLQTSEEIRIIIQTENIQLRQLPWHLWSVFETHYPKSEISFSPKEYVPVKTLPTQTTKKQVKILVILGDSTNINVEKDLELLKLQLPDAEIRPLINPQLEQLSDRLWSQNWDILFFAGHSTSDSGDGQERIYINETESLTIADLKFALRNAIAHGLRLAIFNSCDGLKVAQALEDLQLTASIVMRERVPDEAAQKFLEYFLKAFREEGKSLYIGVRKARERLYTLEKQYPCASWLPVICEHPAAPLLTWQKLGGLPPCPYRGLSAFQEKDAPMFFGREAFTKQLIHAVKTKKLVAVIGSSGSGKSSVVFAGLIPCLQTAATPELSLKIASFRPGKNPFDNLAAALISVQHVTADGRRYTQVEQVERHLAEIKLARELQQNTSVPYHTVESIVQRDKGTQLLLVVDQFEEIYTLVSEEERLVFLDGLLKAVNDAPGFTLVVTLRADFFGRALAYEPLGKLLQQYPPELLISMNREELEAAITLPAQQLGVQLEAGLTEHLINAVNQQPSQLPLLEFTLTQLWEKQRQGILSFAAYREIGGVEEALANHADQVYIQLNEAERERAKQVFIQLVQPGEGTEDTRRLATRAEVGEDNWDLVTYLASARLVVTGRNEKTGLETVEIVHEALIHNWRELSQWMEGERAFRSWQERLRTAMQQWKTRHNHAQEALLHGAFLAEAETWQQQRLEELSPEERVFIQLSLREKEEKERQRRFILGLTRGGLVAALTFAGIAGWQWQRAESQRIQSEISAHNASSEALFLSGKEFDALSESLKTAIEIQDFGVKNNTEIQGIGTLQQALYSVRERNRLEGHGDRVMRVRFSPDGKTIASASFDKTVKLWKRDGTLLTTLKGHTDKVFGVSFSPDGKLIATASFDKTVKLWRLDGTLVRTIRGHGDHVLSVSFSPDGQTIASASDDKTVKLWKLDGTLQKTLLGHREAVFDVTFSPDGSTIASASWDNTVKLWSLNGSLLNTLLGHTDQVNSVTFSPNGQIIATASADKTIKLWTRNGILQQTIKGHKGYIDSVSFSPDGQTIASASEDNTIKLWNLKGVLLETLKGHTNYVNSVTFSPDGQTIASASGDSTIRLWSHSPYKILQGHNDQVDDISFAADGKQIATVGKDGTVRVWNTKGQQLVQFPEKATSVSFSPDGQRIATASFDQTVKLWNRNGTLLRTFKGHTNKVFAVSFSPDGQTIASASFDKTVKLWKLDGTLLRTLEGHKSWVLGVSFSPDGKTLASASSDHTVKVWSLDGILQRTLQDLDEVLSVSFSPDGQTIATASGDNTIKLWKLDGTLLYTLTGHTGVVNSATFSPGGQIIASASEDKTVRLWSRDGTLLKTLQGHTQGVNSVRFSPQGNLIASAGDDGIVILWNLDLDSLTVQACDWLHDYLKNNSYARSQRSLCNFTHNSWGNSTAFPILKWVMVDRE